MSIEKSEKNINGKWIFALCLSIACLFFPPLVPVAAGAWGWWHIDKERAKENQSHPRREVDKR